jgi:hypothetical protein
MWALLAQNEAFDNLDLGRGGSAPLLLRCVSLTASVREVPTLHSNPSYMK